MADVTLLRLLAYMYYGDEETANKAVNWALNGEGSESMPKRTKVKRRDFNEDVWAVFNAYPDTDINNDGRSTNKGEANLKKIEILLKSGYHKDELIDLINIEVSSGKWLRNFTTFLNNLPIVGEQTDIFQQETFKDF